MILFFYGQDTYRMKEKLNEIIESYQKIHKSGLSLKYFEGNDLDFNEIKNEIQTTPMFKEKKLIIFKNILNGLKDKDEFLNFIKGIKNLDEIIVIYEENKIDERKSLINNLKRYAKSQEFKLLDGERLRSWLKKEFSKYQTGVDPRAIEKLVNFVGNDLWQLSNEVKKLVNFKAGKKIKPEDVELLVKPKIDLDIFRTIDAIAQKNEKQALSFIRKHLEKGDSPIYLLSMITYQFRNLLIIKDLIERNRPYYTISKITNLHPFLVKKTYQQASKFTLPELKKIYQKIFQVDLSIKTGKVSPETGLDLLLTEI